MKKCKLCPTRFKGRSDKIFCSTACKSSYFRKLNAVTALATAPIDKILHRNRSILLEVLGKNSNYKKVPREVLDQKKFNFTFLTHYHMNSQNKQVNYLYDISWVIFSDQEILIRRLRS